MGEEGGLYPGGANARPPDHSDAGERIARDEIVPRDGSGAVDPSSGRIVLLSIGMSNTEQQFQGFIEQAMGESGLHPQLTIVNGAQGGRDVLAWAAPEPGRVNPWERAEQQLVRDGVTPDQVQVIWLNEQFRGDETSGFATGPSELRDALREILLEARRRYPNLRLGYVSSRMYGHYTARGQSAYETAWAVKMLVADQIEGDESLRFSGDGAIVPWISWGPYLWADGEGADRLPGGVPGRSDGLEWSCDDFQPDNIHLSLAGRAKVAALLMSFFRSDPTTTPWFLAAGAPVRDGGSGETDAGTGAMADAGNDARNDAGNDAGSVVTLDSGASDGGGVGEADSAGCGCRVTGRASTAMPIHSLLALLITLLLFRMRTSRRTSERAREQSRAGRLFSVLVGVVGVSAGCFGPGCTSDTIPIAGEDASGISVRDGGSSMDDASGIDGGTLDGGTLDGGGTVIDGGGTAIDGGGASCPGAHLSYTITSTSSAPCGSEGELCHTINVSCDGLSRRLVAREREPTSGPATRVALLTTGGQGTRFYGSGPNPEGTIDFLLANGFQVFEIKWNTSWWEPGDRTYRGAFCAFAPTVRWLIDNEAQPTARETVCAQGNSGGALQIGWGLAAYGLDDVIDMAIVSGGPPVARHDLGCFSPSEPGYWESNRDLPRNQSDFMHGYQGTTPGDYCRNFPETPVPPTIIDEYRAGSLASDTECRDFDYPRTQVTVLNHDLDGNKRQARYFYDQIRSRRTWTILPEGEHNTNGTDAGSAEIRRIFQTECHAWPEGG